jgi:hypothetical protein
MKINLFLLVLLFLLFGCSRWIAPPYTTVSILSKVEIGMNINQVKETLGIEPYDVYFTNEKDFVVIYHYRVKDRIMKISGNYNNDIHSENSQLAGKDWYGDDYLAYFYFKDESLKSIITDQGKELSENILIKNNNLFLIQRDELGYYQDNDTIIFIGKRK